MKSDLTTPGKSATLLSLLIILFLVVSACSSNNNNKNEHTAHSSPPVAKPAAPETGVGPVTSVNVGEGIDQPLAEQGKALFESKCTACHKFEERYVGPALGGVTERRNPAWIMNMIMNPQEMTQKDPIAKELLATYMAQMVNQNVTEKDARAILEYFRSVDQKQ